MIVKSDILGIELNFKRNHNIMNKYTLSNKRM